MRGIVLPWECGERPTPPPTRTSACAFEMLEQGFGESLWLLLGNPVPGTIEQALVDLARYERDERLAHL